MNSTKKISNNLKLASHPKWALRAILLAYTTFAKVVSLVLTKSNPIVIIVIS